MRIQKIIAGAFFVGCIVVGIFFTLIYSHAFEVFIFSQIQNTAPAEERMVVSAEVREYLLGRQALSSDLFSEREILHMADVRRLFVGIAILFSILVAGLGILWFFLPKILSSIVQQTSRYAFVTILALGILCLLFFEPVFTVMHEFFFSNDYWLLDPSVDKLIQVYPPPFFLYFLGYYLVIVSIFFFSCGWLLPFFLQKRRHGDPTQ